VELNSDVYEIIRKRVQELFPFLKIYTLYNILPGLLYTIRIKTPYHTTITPGTEQLCFFDWETSINI
jgi:hypothetical protein